MLKLAAVAIVIGTVVYFANYPTNFETEASVIGCEIFVAVAVSISLRS